MVHEEIEQPRIFKVVANDEGQYSIWPTDLNLPLGWMEVGKTGQKEECLAFIKEAWADMRPLSLRKRMEEGRLHHPQDTYSTENELDELKE